MNTIPIKTMDTNKKEVVEKTITKNGMTKSVRVEEVENGFVIKITKEGETKEGWKYECKTYISQTNPLEEKLNSLSLDALDAML